MQKQRVPDRTMTMLLMPAGPVGLFRPRRTARPMHAPPFPPPPHAQTADRGALHESMYLQLLISAVLLRTCAALTHRSERSCSQCSGASGTVRQPQPPAKA